MALNNVFERRYLKMDTVNTSVHTVTVDDLNYDMVVSNIPVLTLIALVAIFGIIGNLVVVVIFSSGYPQCNFKYFVLILATIDLTSCIVLMPLEIVTLSHWFMFPSSALCKFKSFMNAFTVTASSASLLLIAIDRFRKVCKPHSSQISPQLALKLTGVVLVLSLIPAASDGIFWGIHTHGLQYEGVNLTVKLCEKDDQYKHTIWPTLHTVVLYAGSNMVIMVSTLILYTLIARTLFCRPKPILTPEIMITTPETGNARSSVVFRFDEHADRNNTRNDIQSTSDFETGFSESSISGDSTGRVSDDEVLNDSGQNRHDGGRTPNTLTVQTRDSLAFQRVKRTARISLELQVDDGDNQDGSVSLQLPEAALRPKPSFDGSIQGSPTSFSRSRFRRRRSTVHSMKGRMGTKLRRKTFIMFILTIIFVVTTATYLAMISHMAERNTIVRGFTVTDRTVWFLFLRFYFVNSFINPLLYGFLDTRFRRKLWDMGIRVRWLAGSIKRNIGNSMRESSGRTRASK